MSSIATGTSLKERRGEKRSSGYESGDNSIKQCVCQSIKRRESDGQSKAKAHCTPLSCNANGTTSKTKRGTNRHLLIDDPVSLKMPAVQRKKTKDRLRDICLEHGRKSKELSHECDIVCNKIIRAFKNVVAVYPTFQNKDKNNIIFVVTYIGNNVEPDIESAFKDEEEINYVAKAIDTYQFDKKSASGDLPEKDEARLQNCIRKISKRIFTKHRHLTFIQGCTSNLNNDNSEYEQLLEFYVPARGYIPIDEEPFKKSYYGIRVTVREGMFIPLRKFANDVHDHVRMGCKIQRVSSGTLGVFVQHPLYGVCGITCAHVLLNDEEMLACKTKNDFEQYIADVSDYIVYQPSPPHDIGKIREVIVTAGTKSRTALEIAVIQLNKRTPKSGQFPASRQTHEYGLEFTSGRSMEKPKYEDPCFKFGSATDYTEGTILSRVGNAYPMRFPGIKDPIVLDNHIVVQSSGNTEFATNGDSGSPVFVRDCDGELACIGIIVAAVPSSTGFTLVTPISSILGKIEISQLLKFHPTNSKILRDINALKKDVDTFKGEVICKLDQIISTIEKKNVNDDKKS